jgi:hypothetical protein
MIEVIGNTTDPDEVAGILGLAAGLLRFRQGGYINPAARQWHHEGRDVPGCEGARDERVAFWAWPEPTLFRTCLGHLQVEVQPGDVVVVNNQIIEHRMPDEVSASRWFTRVNV